MLEMMCSNRASGEAKPEVVARSQQQHYDARRRRMNDSLTAVANAHPVTESRMFRNSLSRRRAVVDSDSDVEELRYQPPVMVDASTQTALVDAISKGVQVEVRSVSTSVQCELHLATPKSEFGRIGNALRQNGIPLPGAYDAHFGPQISTVNDAGLGIDININPVGECRNDTELTWHNSELIPSVWEAQATSMMPAARVVPPSMGEISNVPVGAAINSYDNNGRNTNQFVNDVQQPGLGNTCAEPTATINQRIMISNPQAGYRRNVAAAVNIVPTDSDIPKHCGFTNLPTGSTHLNKYRNVDAFWRGPVLHCSSEVCGLDYTGGVHRPTTLSGSYDITGRNISVCKLTFGSGGVGFSGLLMKAALLVMQKSAIGKLKWIRDYECVRGKHNVVGKQGLTPNEYELLRILNQQYPVTTDDVVWNYVSIPNSGLKVGRPKKPNIGVLDALPGLIAKCNLLSEWDRALRSAMGLCEYLTKIGSTCCSLPGLSNSGGDIVVTETSQANDLDIDALVIASMIQGDELCVIHNQSGETAGAEQWNALLRTSIICTNGSIKPDCSKLAKGILCAYGYDGVVFRELDHCGIDAKDKVIEWLNSLALMEVDKPTVNVLGYTVLKGCARVMHIPDLDTYAKVHAWADWTAFVQSKAYSKLLMTVEGRPMVYLGSGVSNHWLIGRGGKYAAASQFGRHRMRLTNLELSGGIRCGNNMRAG
jgi:hypothetical protein